MNSEIETAAALDPAAILASVCEVPYRWQIDSDVLIWGVNAGEVLTVPISR